VGKGFFSVVVIPRAASSSGTGRQVIDKAGTAESIPLS